MNKNRFKKIDLKSKMKKCVCFSMEKLKTNTILIIVKIRYIK